MYTCIHKHVHNVHTILRIYVHVYMLERTHAHTNANMYYVHT